MELSAPDVADLARPYDLRGHTRALVPKAVIAHLVATLYFLAASSSRRALQGVGGNGFWIPPNRLLTRL